MFCYLALNLFCIFCRKVKTVILADDDSIIDIERVLSIYSDEGKHSTNALSCGFKLIKNARVSTSNNSNFRTF